MLALGFYVQWRVEDTLEQGLRDQSEGEMNGLEVTAPDDRLQASGGSPATSMARSSPATEPSLPPRSR